MAASACAGEASDIAGEAAAALAHAAVAFADQPRLSAAYWRKAQMAYELTGVDAGRLGNSNDAYSVLKSYYPSSGVVSHVFYGAASMLAACRALRCKGEARYERQALKLAVMKEADGGQKWYWEVPAPYSLTPEPADGLCARASRCTLSPRE